MVIYPIRILNTYIYILKVLGCFEHDYAGLSAF